LLLLFSFFTATFPAADISFINKRYTKPKNILKIAIMAQKYCQQTTSSAILADKLANK
jgi:hypothetical protein